MAKTKTSKPTIVKGSHLTVITYANGRQELIWNWEKLVKEVAKACKDYEKSQKQKK